VSCFLSRATIVLLVGPAAWLADMLNVVGGDATTFLLRRFAWLAVVADPSSPHGS